MAKKQLRSRIRKILQDIPNGATASELSEKIAIQFKADRKSAKRIGAVCAHDPLVTKVGQLRGDNLYALKEHSENNEQME